MTEGNGNDWRERMDRFERGLEHLLETQAALAESQRKNERLMGQALEAINSLARIAEARAPRTSHLEGEA